MEKKFVLDRVAWHTKTLGNAESREDIIYRFWVIVDFLQRHGLVKRQLASSLSNIDENFSITSDDLNEQGIAIMKSGYDKWISKLDKGMSPSDVTYLENLVRKSKG